MQTQIIGKEKKYCTKLTKENKRLNFIANKQFKIHKTGPMFTICICNI